MFERFTDHARRVVVLAKDELVEFKHSSIGTEHLLLALLRLETESGGQIAYQALQRHGISLQGALRALDQIAGKGTSAPTGHIPFTPRAKKVLEFSLREALGLGHNYIGPQHILLGLVREGEGVAAQICVKLGMPNMLPLRATVLELINAQTDEDRAAERATATSTAPHPGYDQQTHVLMALPRAIVDAALDGSYDYLKPRQMALIEEIKKQYESADRPDHK